MEDVIPLNDIDHSGNTDVTKKSYFLIDIDNEEDLVAFAQSKKSITDRFKVYADCALFVQAKRNKERCRYCNKGKCDHDIADGSGSLLVPTDAFGQLEFMKANRKSRAKYIKLSDRTNVNDILDLLKDKWGLVESPKLLISVIGADTTLTWSSETEMKVKWGFQKIAESTKPWVITNGLDCGITEYVANILQGHKYNSTKLIGITTWGIVAGRQCLKTLDSINFCEVQTFFPKYPPIDPLDIAMTGKESEFLRENEYFLNRHHGYFVLVDTGKNGVPHGESFFRNTMERIVTKEQIKSLPKLFRRHKPVKRLKSSDYNSSKYIPAIQIVIGGTPETIERVAETLCVDKPDEKIVMPVIIVEGSGPAADLLTKAYELCDEDCISGYAEKKLMSEIQRLFPEIELPEKCLKIFRLLLKIMGKKEDITIFYGGKDTSFDEAILLLLMKRGDQDCLVSQSTSSKINPDNISFNFVAQLELTMMWNRADIAKKEILKEKKFSYHPTELENLMWWTILENKCSMVELLLESGFNVNSFDHDQLGQSYHQKYILKDSLLKSFVNLKEDGILGNGYPQIIEKEEDPKKCINLRYIRDAFIKLCGFDLTPQYWKPGYQGWEKLKQPLNELFLWAVLCNSQEMAVLFWKRGDEVLAKALIARHLYQSIIIQFNKKNSYMDEKIIEELEANAQQFETLALGTLDVCMKIDRILTKQLLCEPLKNWGNQSCMKLAAASNFEDFIAHPACQNIVAERWHGRVIFYGERVSLKVILGLLFFPVAFMYEYTGYDVYYKKTFFGYVKKKVHEYYIFTTAPITKFWMHVLSYLMFVCLFGYVMYTKFESIPSTIEWVVVAIVFTLAMEETRQIVQGQGYFLRQLIRGWWLSSTNKMDLVAIGVFFIGFTIRMVDAPIYVEVGRVIYALDLMVWILRLLYFFSVEQTLGPYVVMIVKMTEDVFYFGAVLCIFLLSYGVGRYAILEPDGKWSLLRMRQFLMIPYFQIYGDTFLETFETNKNETVFKTTYSNDYTEAVVVVVMVIYFLLTNLLLVNLLIAVFNNTFVKVQTNSKRVWKWIWYCLVEEYIQRPLLVPPFIFFSHVSQLIIFMWKSYDCTQKLRNTFCKNRREERHHRDQSCLYREFNKSRQDRLKKSKNYILVDDKEKTMYELMKFEEECQQMYLQQLQCLECTPQDRKLDQMKEKTSQIEDILRTTLGEMEKMNLKLNKLSNETNSISQRLGRVERLQKNIQTTKRSPSESPKSPLSTVMNRNFKRLLSSEQEGGEVDTKLRKQSKKPQENREDLMKVDNQLNIEGEEEKATPVNLLSRSLRYPFSDVNRFYFPDYMVDWKIDFHAYNPKPYTSQAVLVGRHDTDKETDQNLKFNEIDGKVDRRSFCGVYDVIDNRPRNPIGRTGIIGRGCLKRFGPNHIAEPIITRNKSEDESGTSNGLQVLVVEDELEGTYSLPTGEVSHNQNLPIKLRKFFSSSTLKEVGLGVVARTSTMTAFNARFFTTDSNIVVCEGYLDSEKNTDNAWLETSVVNYHVDNCAILLKFFLNESAVNNLRVRWIDMKEDAVVPEHQLEYLRFIAQKRALSFDSL